MAPVAGTTWSRKQRARTEILHGRAETTARHGSPLRNGRSGPAGSSPPVKNSMVTTQEGSAALATARVKIKFI